MLQHTESPAAQPMKITLRFAARVVVCVIVLLYTMIHATSYRWCENETSSTRARNRLKTHGGGSDHTKQSIIGINPRHLVVSLKFWKSCKTFAAVAFPLSLSLPCVQHLGGGSFVFTRSGSSGLLLQKLYRRQGPHFLYEAFFCIVEGDEFFFSGRRHQ